MQRAIQKTNEMNQEGYEIPSMDTAVRNNNSPKFFESTTFVKANDDFNAKKSMLNI